jgi:peptide/nickel transport system substrate-binding protein
MWIPRLRGILVAALLAVVATGCGGSGARTFSGEGTTDAGGGGELTYAIAAAPVALDPLAANTPSRQAVVSQLYEPLVAALDEPYGGARDRPGLALGWQPSGDLRVWTFRLRRGIEFQDGEAFNANAVAVNVQRWQNDLRGRLLLPSLVAEDAPRPDLVRMIFSLPQPGLPSVLDDPRLGIVSPQAIESLGGLPADLERVRGVGTGPFEIRSRGNEMLRLSRFRRWWGSPIGLGPALDRVAFTVIADDDERVQALRAGEVRVAAELPQEAAESLAGDPLLTVAGENGDAALGFQRSVRGIDSSVPTSLNGVWLSLLPGI